MLGFRSALVSSQSPLLSNLSPLPLESLLLHIHLDKTITILIKVIHFITIGINSVIPDIRCSHWMNIGRCEVVRQCAFDQCGLRTIFPTVTVFNRPTITIYICSLALGNICPPGSTTSGIHHSISHPTNRKKVCVEITIKPPSLFT